MLLRFICPFILLNYNLKIHTTPSNFCVNRCDRVGYFIIRICGLHYVSMFYENADTLLGLRVYTYTRNNMPFNSLDIFMYVWYKCP